MRAEELYIHGGGKGEKCTHSGQKFSSAFSRRTWTAPILVYLSPFWSPQRRPKPAEVLFTAV